MTSFDLKVKPTIEAVHFGFFVNLWMKRETNDYKHLRMGQAFHQYFELEKSIIFKNYYDRLYEADGEKAEKMIHELFDIC